MLLREAKEMIRRFLPILLCLLLLSSFSGVYATWYYTTDRVNPEQKNLMVSINEFDYPEIVYIIDTEYLSGDGTYTSTNYYRSVFESSVAVPKGTELTFRITVFNNSKALTVLSVPLKATTIQISSTP